MSPEGLVMEPSKKDFSADEVVSMLSEIDQIPQDGALNLCPEASAALAKVLGDELEEFSVFGGDSAFEKQLPERTAFEPHASEKFTMENWLREVVRQKVGEIIRKEDVSQMISKRLDELAPPLIEKLITQEIEKLKKQIGL